MALLSIYHWNPIVENRYSQRIIWRNAVISSLIIINFTTESSHTTGLLYIWMPMLSYLLDRTELGCSVLACIEECWKKQLSKLCSWIYNWDRVQDSSLWIKKCFGLFSFLFFYEDPRETFFSAQQDGNFKQWGCLCKWTTEHISLL